MIRHSVPGVAGYEVVMDITPIGNFEVYIIKSFMGATIRVWSEYRDTEEKARVLANSYWTSIKNGKRP